MKPEHLPDMKKITMVSYVLLALLILTFISITLMVFGAGYLTATSPTSEAEHFFSSTSTMSVTPDAIKEGVLTSRDKSWMFSGLIFAALLILPGLFFAVKLVWSFRQRKIFTDINVPYARYIALLYLVIVVIQSISGLITSWVPREGFDFSFNPLLFSRDYIMLCFVWLLVWILDIGRELHLDSELSI